MVLRKQKNKRIKTWEEFPQLTLAVRQSHEQEGGIFFGHNFDHALRVSNYATIIAKDTYTARLSGVAGMCHNADRIIQHKQNKGAYGVVDCEVIKKLVISWLNKESKINTTEYSTIIDAVMSHSNKNNPNDNHILITLMDADRLVNIEADLIIREGQFLPNMHPVDPISLLGAKNADFFKPGSVARHIQEILDWEILSGPVGIRIPSARKIAKSRFKFLKLFLKTIIYQRKESGIIPYPEIK